MSVYLKGNIFLIHLFTIPLKLTFQFYFELSDCMQELLKVSSLLEECSRRIQLTVVQDVPCGEEIP